MAKTKVISAKEAAALIKDGDTVLVGGFMTNGTAKSIVNEVTAKDLTVVCNDAGFENEGTGRLLHNGLIKRLIATHVGLNKEVAAKFNAGEIELKLQPQGTLAEQVKSTFLRKQSVVTLQSSRDILLMNPEISVTKDLLVTSTR